MIQQFPKSITPAKKSPGYALLLLPLFIMFSGCAAKPFRMVLLPDTQSYSRAYPAIFHAQTEWIARQADSIAFVLHQGDITDDNVPSQWEVARAAMQKMDGKVPYSFVPGNHDLGRNSDVRDSELLNRYFPYDHYSRLPHFGGAFESGKTDNTWHTFSGGGKKWLVLSLEFGPRNEVLQWANTVIAAHPRHLVIINTHAYMYSDSTRMGEGDSWLPQGYGLGKDTGAKAPNNGEQMWEKLVSRHPGVLMVFSGHVLHGGTGTLVSEGKHGNKVYQMLANYQQGVKGSENGGNGFLRILTVDVKRKEIRVQTYSPYLDRFMTDAGQSFIFGNVRFR